MKPVSNLPWKDDAEDYIWGADGDLINSRHEDYRAYIVHAANHFPQLVEALQNLMLAADDMAYHRNPSKAEWDDLSTFIESARAALAAAQKGLGR